MLDEQLHVQRLQVFVLADTSYNSSGVDEVAAEHADADCVVRLVSSSGSSLVDIMCQRQSSAFASTLDH